MGFWIDNQGLFMSAPSYATGGGCDMDNAIPVYDWENWDELSAYHHSALMHVNQMCIPVSYTHLTLPTTPYV